MTTRFSVYNLAPDLRTIAGGGQQYGARDHLEVAWACRALREPGDLYLVTDSTRVDPWFGHAARYRLTEHGPVEIDERGELTTPHQVPLLLAAFEPGACGVEACISGDWYPARYVKHTRTRVQVAIGSAAPRFFKPGPDTLRVRADPWAHKDGSSHSAAGPLGCLPCSNKRRDEGVRVDPHHELVTPRVHQTATTVVRGNFPADTDELRRELAASRHPPVTVTTDERGKVTDWGSRESSSDEPPPDLRFADPALLKRVRATAPVGSIAEAARMLVRGEATTVELKLSAGVKALDILARSLGLDRDSAKLYAFVLVAARQVCTEIGDPAAANTLGQVLEIYRSIKTLD